MEAELNMARRIQLRRDTAANWSSVNPLLAQGEIGLDLTNSKIKIGDGITYWNSLEYFDDKENDTSSLVNGVHSLTLASNGNLTFPDNLSYYNDGTVDTSIFQKSVTSETNDTVGSRVYLTYNEVGLEQYEDPDGPNNTNRAKVKVNAGGVRLEISQEVVGAEVYSRLDMAPTGLALSNTDGVTTNTFLIDGNALVLPNNGIIQQQQSFTRTTNSTVTASTPTVVWSGLLDSITSVKLNIQVEGNETGDTTGLHSQSCEAIIAARWWTNAGNSDPQMSVYGVIHTSVDPLATFTVQRNNNTHLIEVVATPTGTTNGTLYTKIYSVEMNTND